MAKPRRNTKPTKAKAKPRPSAAANDDTEIVALALPPAPLPPDMAAYFAKCEEKLGFVPNVLKAYAFDAAKLAAFVAMYNDLMLAPSGLSKLEREMIAVAVSSHNRCYYCLVAHGAVAGRGGRPCGAAPVRLQRPRHLGHRRGGRLLQHVEPRGVGHRHAAEPRLSRPGAVKVR
jgi:AhpD family alkylhydroperoxidase